jgi:hypothetical protein
VDGAGNWSDTGHWRLLVDGKPPAAQLVTRATGQKMATSRLEWEVGDEGPAGVDPQSVRVRVNGVSYDVSDPALSYNAQTHRLVWDGSRQGGQPVVSAAPRVQGTLELTREESRQEGQPVVFADGQQVEASLEAVRDYAGNPAALPPPARFVMDYASDHEPPAILEIDSSTHRMALADTFETDLGHWKNKGGAFGAKVERVTDSPSSGKYCVKLTNQQANGSMAATICDEPIDLARYPIVAFDYKITPDVHLDLMVKIGDQWYAVAFTDDPAGAAYRVPLVRADGKWHSASFDLATALRRQDKTGRLKVSEISLTDRERMDNAAGAVACFDNFFIGRVGAAAPALTWTAVDATGVTGYSYTLDQQPDTAPEEKIVGQRPNVRFDRTSGGVWFFHLRARDGAGNWSAPAHYALMHLAAPPSK